MTFHPRNTTRRFRHRVRAGRPRASTQRGGGMIFSPSATAAAMAAGLAVGCARHSDPQPGPDDSLPPQEPPTLWNSPHYQPVKHPAAVVVAEGLPPVLYNLKRGDRVRVIDVTADKELASAVADGPVIVNVQQTGVFIGDQRFRAGPMAMDHQYRIVLDVGPDQPWRTSVEIAPIREPLTTHPAPPERP